MIIYNKEKFFNQYSNNRFFEISNVYHVGNLVDTQPIQILNPDINYSFPQVSSSSYITIREWQYGDGIDTTTIVAKFGNSYYFSENYVEKDLYILNGNSLTAFTIPESATTANKLLSLNRNFLLFPNSITSSCDWIIYSIWTNYTEMNFDISFDKSQIDHLYTTNFTFYNNSITSGSLTSDVYNKMLDEGLYPESGSAYINAYAHNYFIMNSIHEQKMYIDGIILYDRQKIPMVVITFKYPFLLSNNLGQTFKARIIF